MPDEMTSTPAPVAEAPQDTETPAVAASSTPPVTETPAAPPVTVEPDLDSLLKDQNSYQKLLTHPSLQTELQRQRSEGGRRAKAELDQYRAQVEEQQRTWQAQWEEQQRQAELQRVSQMDDDEAGQHYKQTLAQQREQARLQQQAQEMAQRMTQAQMNAQQSQMLGYLAQQAHQTVQEAKNLTDAEKAALHPAQFPTWSAYLQAVVGALTTKEVAAKLPALVKVEAEARVQERLGQTREETPTVPTLPQGGPALADKAFLASYAAGDSDDHKRARLLLGAL